MKDIYNIAYKIKPFKNENELPLDEEIVIEYMDENERFFTLIGKVEIYNNERFFITKSSSLPMTFKSLNLKAWGLLLKKDSRVYLDFSESELEELQELFEYLKQRLEEAFDESISTFRKSYERKLNNLKKFRDKFSKVEF